MDKETRYKKDKIQRETADLDKEMAFDAADTKKKADLAVERMNWELVKAFQNNSTFLNFMLQYFQAFYVWGNKNQLDFWQVGADSTKSTISRNGKIVTLTACFTQKNPNPITGEKMSDNGVIIPGVF